VNDEHSPEARGVSDETNKHTSFDADERGGIVQLVRAEGVEEEVEVGGAVDVCAEFRFIIINTKINRRSARVRGWGCERGEREGAGEGEKRNTHQQRQN
jgi:hypothetical protein